MLAEVRVDDGAAPPYILTFTVRLRNGSWIADRLGAGHSGGAVR
jgi:hypothetical protein